MEILSQGIGNWTGISEVYDGQCNFIGNATDNRSITQIGHGAYNVKVAISGPIMLQGSYDIKIGEDHHSYQGDAHVGFAEHYDDVLLASNGYWSQWGLSERNMVMLAPELNGQLSMSLLNRGDQLLYTIVGEYYENGASTPFTKVMGTPYDRINDPTAGRGGLLMHRAGTWSGQVSVLDENLAPMGKAHYTENIRVRNNELILTTEGGGFTPIQRSFHLTTNGWHAWTDPGDVVGSYNMFGGRAMSGYFHYVGAERRIWRREIVTSDGKHKSILHYVYKGDKRLGLQYGMLAFHKT